MYGFSAVVVAGRVQVYKKHLKMMLISLGNPMLLNLIVLRGPINLFISVKIIAVRDVGVWVPCVACLARRTAIFRVCEILKLQHDVRCSSCT